MVLKLKDGQDSTNTFQENGNVFLCYLEDE